MKKSAIAAALIVVTAMPAGAGGYVGALFNYSDVSFGADPKNFIDAFSVSDTGWQAEGAFGFQSGEFGFQADGGVGTTFGRDFWTLTGHGYWAGDRWKIGAVISFSEIDHGNDFFGARETESDLTVGLEGAFEITSNVVARANFTLGELEDRISGGMFTNPAKFSYDTRNVAAGLSAYLSPNAKLDATVGYGEASRFQDDTTAWNMSVGIEYQPWSAPLTIHAKYHVNSSENLAYGSETDTQTVSVGLRWSFGSESLRERDRSIPFDDRYGRLQNAYDLR